MIFQRAGDALRSRWWTTGVRGHRRAVFAFLGACLGVVIGASGAYAATPEASLVVAQRAEVTSIDPHYANYGPNMVLAAHLFDRLVHQDENQRPEPGLALAWRAISPTKWQFVLRPNVRFHDGTRFDAEDVVSSWRRVERMKGPSSMAIYSRSITAMTAVGDLLVEMETSVPWPLLPLEISQMSIISSDYETATTEDFEAGKAAIGTGPFRLVTWNKGDSVELAANSKYWGGGSHWSQVTLKTVSDDAARVTALIEGSVDMIDSVPPVDAGRMATSAVVRVASIPTSRVIYLGFDFGEAPPPGTTARDGSPLARNPFLDLRVRKAVSLAIDRTAIVKHAMDGRGVPAGQLLPDTLFGALGNGSPDTADPDEARRLLVDAGYPQGFLTRLDCTRNRYVNDSDICQAIGLALTGIGIEARVQTWPSGEFFSKAAEREFSIRMAGWGTGTGEASYTLRGLLGARDMERGVGVSNYGHYSNPELDALVGQAVEVFDDGRRQVLLQAAMHIARQDLGVIPLHFQNATWATRAGIIYTPRNDEFTLIRDVSPAP